MRKYLSLVFPVFSEELLHTANNKSLSKGSFCFFNNLNFLHQRHTRKTSNELNIQHNNSNMFSSLAVTTSLLITVIAASAAAFSFAAADDSNSNNLDCFGKPFPPNWPPEGMVYNKTVWEAFANKTLLNPFPVPAEDWNPYDNANGTNPPWPLQVCAVVYPNAADRSKYMLKTFESYDAAVAAGAFVTHNHPCNLCSTLKDLSVYMSTPDLTDPGRKCGLLGLISPKLATECWHKIGFTSPCAKIWARDAQNTRKMCYKICMKAWLEHIPNNEPCTPFRKAPSNSSQMCPCIKCDEDHSGPVFKFYAGRTRRDSGLKSTINRPPDSVCPIVHNYY